MSCSDSSWPLLYSCLCQQRLYSLSASFSHWKLALHAGILLLEKAHYVSPLYYQKIINDQEKLGYPFYLIAPGIAIPHSRPENGALKTGVSLITLNPPLLFHQNHIPVSVLMCFASQDSHTHIHIVIKELCEFLESPERISLLSQIHEHTQLEKLICQDRAIT